MTSEVSFYLGLATAIATFSAAAVGLGLLQCTSSRQRGVSVAVLLTATVGIEAAFATVLASRTTAARDVFIGVAILTTALFVLSRALRSVFTEQGRDDQDPATALRADSRPPDNVLRWPMRVTSGVFAGVVVLATVLAMSDVFDDFFRSRPLGVGARKPLRVVLAMDLSSSMGCPLEAGRPCPPLPKAPPQRVDSRIEAAIDTLGPCSRGSTPVTASVSGRSAEGSNRASLGGLHAQGWQAS